MYRLARFVGTLATWTRVVGVILIIIDVEPYARTLLLYIP